MRRARKKDRTYRRRWCDRLTRDVRLTDGAKSWLRALATRSDDAGKPVWGAQRRQADELGRHHGSVRRYRAEAETLGYVRTLRADPVQDPDTGQWSRPRTNTYVPTMPPAELAGAPAPRRRQRAGYCVVDGQKPWSRRARTNARSTAPKGREKTTAGPSMRGRPPRGVHASGIPASQKVRDLPAAVDEALERLARDELRAKQAVGTVNSPDGWVRWRRGRGGLDELYVDRALELLERDPELTGDRLARILTRPDYYKDWENRLERRQADDVVVDANVGRAGLAAARARLESLPGKRPR